jgi:hypothetical protein
MAAGQREYREGRHRTVLWSSLWGSRPHVEKPKKGPVQPSLKSQFKCTVGKLVVYHLVQSRVPLDSIT